MPRGLKEIKSNLGKAIKGIRWRTVEGVTDAAQFVGLSTIPRTPFDTGKLRRSLIVTNNADTAKPKAAVAFTDPKAAKVHEIKLRYKIGGWKFLEVTLDQSHQEILRHIHAKARIR